MSKWIEVILDAINSFDAKGLEVCLQRRAESNWLLFLLIVQRMFTYQLTIDGKHHSFVFSPLPVVPFLCLLCVLYLGSKRGLAVCLLDSGLALLLLLCSVSSSSSSPCCTALLAVLEYIWLWMMMVMAASTWDLGTRHVLYFFKAPYFEAREAHRYLNNWLGIF